MKIVPIRRQERVCEINISRVQSTKWILNAQRGSPQMRKDRSIAIVIIARSPPKKVILEVAAFRGRAISYVLSIIILFGYRAIIIARARWCTR